MKSSSISPGTSRVRLFASLALLVGAVLFVYAQYHSSVPQAPEREERRAPPQAQDGPPPTANPGDRPEPGRLLNRGERENMRAEMTEKLGLSEEQLKKIEAIDKQLEGQRGPEVWATRAQAMSEVLTPDQHQKMREMQGELRERFQERMKQRALERASVLPEGERELFLKKLEERMAQGPPRWGRGEGRGGDAPPPPPE